MRLSLGGMFGQQGLQRLLKRLPRLKRLELSGLNTATDQVLAQLMGSSGSGGDGGSAASLEVRSERDHKRASGRCNQASQKGSPQRKGGDTFRVHNLTLPALDRSSVLT